MDATLHTDIGDDGVAVLTLDRPARRNALTGDMWAALPKLLDELAADPRVRALVLTGAGATFCAGADIEELRATYAHPADADAFHAVNVAAEEALAGFPRPTVAAVDGACVGGGAQLAVACDLRFAAAGAYFAVPPARLGVVYPASATVRLAQLVGPARAKYLLYSAAAVDAARAYAYGLVDEVVDRDVRARACEFAAGLAANSAQTLGAAADVLRAFEAGRDPAAAAAPWERRSRTDGDVHEGLTAFLERRPPRFHH
ncbi:enoyl-CoA hydratase [Pilimelia terevasa]|uniref:Enoyl-CoA hydratase n=1 Tax=Pilimelia terevasa TaxID=53372 RepID=A0A8J3BU49_9ACTN|nr:enoyl-CoA hydratase/isomerase family protein [Pilimelia terevasa]GGK42549.1 enoyl-CoA hydratase [Pilimelia terevasa]